VQFPKTGGTWVNRVKVRVAQGSGWLTVPVRRDYHGVRPINEIQIDNSKSWRDRMRKTLEANYRRTPHFHPTMDVVADILSYEGDSLSELNIRGLRKMLAYIGLSSRSVVTSGSLDRHEAGTDLLVAIARAVHADTYLSGDGADEYQDRGTFAANGITLTFQGFEHPTYSQTGGGAFQRGLSIVDALFEIGPSATARLLEVR